MEVKYISKVFAAQDGAIWDKYLFRFDTKGKCNVYDMEKVLASASENPEDCLLSSFSLDRSELIAPHSNAVVFGTEYYEEGDEFPLLYSNVYNNYASADDKLIGVCCVYRIERCDSVFSSRLVQLIEIGFSGERGLWLSSEGDDVRPFGNFVIDRDTATYYAFVMRDSDKTTRYFAFDLPKISDGVVDEKYGVRRVTLGISDIKKQFDAPYHRFIQGACAQGGRIYSVEGFSRKDPALRIIDPKAGEQVFHFDFMSAGLEIEPEFIDFYEGKCIYGDAWGNLYELVF